MFAVKIPKPVSCEDYPNRHTIAMRLAPLDEPRQAKKRPEKSEAPSIPLSRRSEVMK